MRALGAAGLLLLFGLGTAPGQTPADAVARAVRPAVLRAHLEFLASDQLEGRATGARGGALAARYVAAQFERLGLEPSGDGGTYFQPIPLRGRSFASSLAVRGGPPLTPGTDFVAYATGSADSVGAAGQVVFAGYGITAPEERWDDYAGADVGGKIVLVLAGTPADANPALFQHPGRGDYGFRQYKVSRALERGARAVFVIYRASFPVPWSEVADSWLREQIQLADSTPAEAHVAGWLNTPAAEHLVAGAGASLAELATAAAVPGFRPRPLALDLTATVRATSRGVPGGVNVLGRLPGGTRSGEAVLLGAHYDHLGVGSSIDGDSIYNGAIDNASGTAGMLAIAEACVSARLRPARSIIFAAFGAEELGLLGSQGYVRRPVVPLDRTAAMLNLDGVNLTADTRDIAALGAEWSSLGAVFQRAAAAEGYALTPRDGPIMREAAAQDFFNRSDQAPFARAGVPALFLYFGDQIVGSAAGSGKTKLDEYLQRYYHRPNDDLAQPFDYAAGAHSLRAFARTLVAIADAPASPRWQPDAPYRR